MQTICYSRAFAQSLFLISKNAEHTTYIHPVSTTMRTLYMHNNSKNIKGGETGNIHEVSISLPSEMDFLYLGPLVTHKSLCNN